MAGSGRRIHAGIAITAVVLITLASLTASLRGQAASVAGRTIVALYGYGPDTIANLRFSEGLRSVLRGAGSRAPSYITEYLDATASPPLSTPNPPGTISRRSTPAARSMR